MIDLFGIKARQDSLDHMKKIEQLEDKIKEQNRIIQMQQQRIKELQYRLPFGNDIDYPGSNRR